MAEVVVLGAGLGGTIMADERQKIRRGESEPFYDRFLLKQLNIEKLKEPS